MFIHLRASLVKQLIESLGSRLISDDIVWNGKVRPADSARSRFLRKPPPALSLSACLHKAPSLSSKCSLYIYIKFGVNLGNTRVLQVFASCKKPALRDTGNAMCCFIYVALVLNLLQFEHVYYIADISFNGSKRSLL